MGQAQNINSWLSTDVAAVLGLKHSPASGHHVDEANTVPRALGADQNFVFGDQIHKVRAIQQIMECASWHDNQAGKMRVRCNFVHTTQSLIPDLDTQPEPGVVVNHCRFNSAQRCHLHKKKLLPQS